MATKRVHVNGYSRKSYTVSDSNTGEHYRTIRVWAKPKKSNSKKRK